MTTRGTENKTRGKGAFVTGSVLAGLLLVPASAFAAVAIVGATSGEPSEDVLEATTTTALVVVVAEEAATTTGAPDEAKFISVACTEGAEELIEKEMAGTLGDLEAAALDALRQICEDNGVPIIGPPQPEPIIEIVTLVAAPDGSSDQGSSYRDDDDEDDEDDDEDDEDEEDDD